MIAFLVALFAPFILWPVEFLLPYPHIIEEFAKAGIVLLLIKETGVKNVVKAAILLGVVFAFSESVMYMMNIFSRGEISTIFLRLIATTTLHTATFVLIASTARYSRYLIALGLGLAILIHYLYNLYIPLV